jgi:hypothetical protein
MSQFPTLAPFWERLGDAGTHIIPPMRCEEHHRLGYLFP